MKALRMVRCGWEGLPIRAELGLLGSAEDVIR